MMYFVIIFLGNKLMMMMNRPIERTCASQPKPSVNPGRTGRPPTGKDLRLQ